MISSASPACAGAGSLRSSPSRPFPDPSLSTSAVPTAYSLPPPAPARAGQALLWKFLPDSAFLRQHVGVEKRLIMVKLYYHRDIEIAVRPAAAAKTSGPQISQISADFQERQRARGEDNRPPRPSSLLLESEKIRVICGSRTHSGLGMYRMSRPKVCQGEQDIWALQGRDNPQFLAGDGLASTPCPVRADFAKRTQFGTVRLGRAWGRGAIVQNEANFGESGWDRRAKRAKQSQTWEDWGMWAKAVIVSGTASPGSGTCETKPIPPAGTGPQGRGTRDKCAKRTQFQGMGRLVEYPAFHYSIIPPFQSHADCAKQTQFRDPGRASGADRAKRTQFAAPAGALRRAGGGRCLRGSQLCKTNPISGGRDTPPSPRPEALRLPPPGTVPTSRNVVARFDWSLSRLRAIMAACRRAFHNPN
jgi:hypothetical protein